MIPVVALLAIASPAALFADYRGTLTLSDRVEARVRDTQAQNDPSFEIENVPEARAIVDMRRTRLTGSYAPRLTLRALQTGFNFDALHTGTLAFDWQAARTVRISLREDASFGERNLAVLIIAPVSPPVGAVTTGTPTGPTVNAQPTPNTVAIGSSSTALSALLLPSRRLQLTTTAAYIIEGGRDRTARQYFPLRKGPRFEVGTDYFVSRVDRFVTSFAASEVAVMGGQFFGASTDPLAAATAQTLPDREFLILEGMAGWRHAWRRQTEGRLEAGIADVRFHPSPSDPYRFQTYPIAEGTLTHRFPFRSEQRVEVLANARLYPTVSVITGLLDQRVQWTSGVTWRRRLLSLNGQFGGAQTLPPGDGGAVRLFFIAATATYRVGRFVALEGGGRFGWQQTTGEPGVTADSSSTQKSVFVAVTLTAPATKF